MPIFIEAKPIAFGSNPFASHAYLVYVPAGEEENYDAWKTIGAYPSGGGTDSFGSNTLLNGEFIDSPLNITEAKDRWLVSLFESSQIAEVASELGIGEDSVTVSDLVNAGYGDTASGKRERTLVYEGSDEFNVWASMVSIAHSLDDEFTYKVVDAVGGNSTVFGPTVNSNSFVTSVLRHEDLAGKDILAFETSVNEPGNLTWLGTDGDDHLDGSASLANGEQARDLFGGKGSDTLIGANVGILGNLTNPIYLVAGDDFDKDNVQGGNGRDVIVGYYNHGDLSNSDVLKGGGGKDEFVVIDPDLAKPGGIPDLQAAFNAVSQDFSFSGTPVGSGGFIDGGDGDDTLSYEYVNTDVHLKLDPSLIINVEDIQLSQLGNDLVIVEDVAPYDGVTIDGEGGSNTFSIRDGNEGVVIDGTPSPLEFFEPTWTLTTSSGSATLTLNDFDNYVLTEHDDEANMRLFDENGVEVAAENRILVFANDGLDQVTGTLGHDDLHGGLGNDIIVGGDGADWLYDRGADGPIDDNQSFDSYVAELMAYDPDGDDELDGGDGADILVFSGGTDIYRGGSGDDLYMATTSVTGTDYVDDHLTIMLSEDTSDPDNLELIGHDLIIGGGDFVDVVIFEGMNLADVSVKYSYEEVYLGSAVLDFDPFYASWFYDFEPQTLDHYATVGTYEITVIETGSTLTVDSVTGFYSSGSAQGSMASVEAAIAVPFKVQFDDGLLDWAGAVLDPDTNHYGFKNEEVSEDAYNALTALEEERSVTGDPINGDEDPNNPDDEMSGTTNSDAINGGLGNDTILAGAGNDVLTGGSGGDVLNGGSGIDTASYATAEYGIRVSLGNESFFNYTNDAEGDTLISIENVEGSNLGDTIWGNSGHNTLWGLGGNDTFSSGRNGAGSTMFGGDGNDTFRAYAGSNTVYGEDGDDRLFALEGGDDYLSGGIGDDYFYVDEDDDYGVGNDVLDGGAGIDTANLHAGVNQYEQVIVDLLAGTAFFSASGDYVKISHIENIVTEYGDDIIYGDDAANVFEAGRGDDLIYGGGGDDRLLGERGHDKVFGGTGTDTAVIAGYSDTVSFQLVDGGVRITVDADNSYIIQDDIEFIEFYDETLTYAEVASPLISEFDLVDDYVRTDEAATIIIDLFANDLKFNGNALSLLAVDGVQVEIGDMIQFASGATATVLSDGQLEIDQEGVFAWLNDEETGTLQFSYTATDVSGIEKTAEVTIVVDGADSRQGTVHLKNQVISVTSNADAADMTRVANFNLANSAVIVDGVLVDPNDPPAGILLEDINGDTFVRYGPDDAIILEDITLSVWQAKSRERNEGTSGDDVINGTSDAEFLDGGDGNDEIFSGGGNDFINGGNGDDYISLGEGSFVVFGGEGNDEIGSAYSGTTGTGNDLIFGNAGADKIYGGYGDDELHGGDGDDSLSGFYGNDHLIGGDGDDTLRGGSGTDIIDGGAGNDTFVLDGDGARYGATIDLNAQIVNWRGLYENETLIGIENATGNGGDDILIGDDGQNRLFGNGGDDIFYGGGGNDRLLAAIGNNIMYGEAGSDNISSSSAGADQLYGGAGDDVLNAVVGHNFLDGGEGIDTVSLRMGWAVSSWAIDVDLTAGWQGTGEDRSELVNIENVLGNSRANTIVGNSGANLLEGMGGDDVINGRNGDDILVGGDGADIFQFATGDGADTITDFNVAEDRIEINGLVFYPESGLTGVAIRQEGVDLVIEYGAGDTLLLQGVDLAAWHASQGVVSGSDDDDAISVGSGNDTIIAGAGNDTIMAGAGNDVLIGGTGDDLLSGGEGDDRFQFMTGDGSDIIQESSSNAGFDRIVFDSSIAPEDVTFSRSSDGADLVIHYGINDQITVRNHLAVSNGKIDAIAFASGISWDQAEILARLNNAGPGDDMVIGSASDDILSGGAGDDVLTGLGGADTYEYALNDGNDIIRDGGTDEADIDIVRLGEGITPDGVDVIRDGDDIVLTITATGETITLANRLVDALASADGVLFADETYWDYEELLSLSDPAIGNLAPTATDDTAATDLNTPLVFDVSQLLANDTDPEGGALTITAVAAPFGGQVEMDGSQIRFTPTDGFAGNGEFTYTIADQYGATSTATVHIQIAGGTAAPVAVGDAATVSEDGTVLVDVLSNDSDPDGDPLTITGVTGAVAGIASVESGQIRYTPNADFNGQETLTYAIADGRGGVATGVLTVTVTPENDAPVIADETATMDENGTILIDVLQNDDDIDGDALTLVSVSGAENGTVSIEAGQLRYVPDTGFDGVETITYEVSDGAGGLATGMVTVTVVNANEAPIAMPDTVLVDEDDDVLIDVTANDTDNDGDSLTLVNVGTAANGTVVIENNQLRYTPNADFHGTDAVTYTIEDGHGGTASGTVEIAVNPVNDAPVAVADTVVIAEDNDILIDVVGNDTDPDGDTLTLLSIDDVINGSAVIEAGQVRFTPAENYNGLATIGYTISDGQGGTASSSVQIDIAAVNDAPIAVNDTATVDSGQVVFIDALTNDSDPDGDSLAITSVDPATNGTVTIENNQLRYVPDAGFVGEETLSYTVSDGQGGSASASVLITVNPVDTPNNAPVAVDDTADVDQGANVLIDVLSNDSDPDGDTLIITSVTASANATAVIEGDAIRYTPNAGFSGPDTITYEVSDGAGGTATASVQVEVAAVQAGAPIVVDDYVTVVSGGTILIDALANDSDPDGDGIYISSVAPTIAQSIQFVNGKILYEALDNYTGVVEMVYTVSDFGGTSSTGSVFIDIVAANSGPIANDDTASVDENGSVLIDVLANDDAGGGTLTITSVTPSANGTAVIEGGAIRYTPNPGFSGPDTITYEVSDGAGVAATASVQLDVAAVQDGAPIVVDDYVTVVSGGTILIDALANDSHPDGSFIYISNVAPTIAESLQFVNGQIQYEALANYTGVVEMVYTVSDLSGVTSTGTVFIDVVAPAAASSQANLAQVQSAAPVSVLNAGSSSMSEAVMADFSNNEVSLDLGQFKTTCFAAPPNDAVKIECQGPDEFVFNSADDTGQDAFAGAAEQVDITRSVFDVASRFFNTQENESPFTDHVMGSLIDLLDSVARIEENDFIFV